MATVQSRFSKLATKDPIRSGGPKAKQGEYVLKVKAGKPAEFVKAFRGQELFVVHCTVLEAEQNNPDIEPTKVGEPVDITQTVSDVGDSYILTLLLAIMGELGTEDQAQAQALVPAILLAIESDQAVTATVGGQEQAIGPDFLAGLEFRMGVYPPKHKPRADGRVFNTEQFRNK